MLDPLIVCGVATFVGWVLAQCAARFAFARKLPCATVERISYGGVTRACMPVGGVILAFAFVCFSIPLGILGMVQMAGSTLFLTGFALGFVNVPHILRGGLFLLLVCAVPDALGAGLGAVLSPILKRQLTEADLVPGIPAALFAPALLGGGAFLVIVHGDQSGLLGLNIGGAMAALHPLHRFPPRLTLGGSGVAVVAGATGFLVWHFLQHGSGLALLLLWSFVWAELAMRLWHGRVSDVPPFECARLRGEPEAGLTLATFSLNLAGVVLLWTVSRQPFAMQIGAIGAILALQLQFCAFLTRQEVKRSHSAEPPATSAES